MKQKIFSVYDAKAEAFTEPFFAPTRGVAVRSMTQAVNDPSHVFGRHPEDYTLFELGEFEAQSGSLVAHAAPQSVVVAATLRTGE